MANVLVATSAHNAIKKILWPANRMISVVKLDVVDESGLILLNCGGDVFVNIGRTTVLYWYFLVVIVRYSNNAGDFLSARPIKRYHCRSISIFDIEVL